MQIYYKKAKLGHLKKDIFIPEKTYASESVKSGKFAQ
jgi:hypothetical protein